MAEAMIAVNIPSVVISTDAAFREALKRALTASRQPITVAAEITVPFTAIADQQLKQLREARPVIVFVDLEADPVLGVKLVQFLADSHPDLRFVAAGPAPSPELLMNAMQAGVSEYLTKPLTQESLSGALERMERKLGAAGGVVHEPGKLLAFFSAKGGSGSSTVAANLAIHLHQLTDKRVLLLDLDLELGEIALFLGVQPRFNFVDLVHNFHRLDAELLASYIERHESGVHLLSAPFHPEKVEAVSGDQIRQILKFLKHNYDYVVVDTPRSFSPAATAAFEQSDAIYIVTAVDLPSLRNIKRSLPLLERITGAQLKDRVRLVVNRYHPDNVISLEEVHRTLGLNVHWKLSNDYEAVINSINAGKPLMSDNRNSAVKNDLRALGAEIAGLKPLAGKKRSGLRGLFRNSTS
ncbi:MAG TPA: AAA family ATPase [Longimicrobiales bacterium]|nr:AAA family ATPase [Longimicrobiales bacterium]